MIRTDHLTKQYNGRLVLDLPALTIEQGESFGLVGNNGAGKTTFFSMILDIIEATGGTVFSKDRDVKRSEHWKSYTGSYLDERYLIDFLTAEEYFEFIARVHELRPEALLEFYDQYNEFFAGEILEQNKYIRDFSRGNQKKIGIAAALMSKPEIIILDEPFPHLDPSSVNRLKRILQSLQDQQNVTLLISSHDLNHITEVCQRIALLEKGLIIRDMKTNDSTLEELQAYFSTG